MILEGNHSSEVKEQALCILANIADGDTAKDFIMNNDNLLKKLQDNMVWSSDSRINLVALLFFFNNFSILSMLTEY